MIVAGLDQDYLGKPFEPMPQLLAIAEYITKTLAICMVCGNPANHTQRLVASDDRVLLGAQGMYEARCRACFDPPGAPCRRAGDATPDAQAPAGPAKPAPTRAERSRQGPARSERLRIRSRSWELELASLD